MARWSRVWSSCCRPSINNCGSTICPSSSALPSSMLNCTGPPSGHNGSIFDGIPDEVISTADALGYWLDLLAIRVGSKPIIIKTTAAADSYTCDVRRANKPIASLTIKPTGGSVGNYPVTVEYNYNSDSGSSSFGHMEEAIEWIIEIIK